MNPFGRGMRFANSSFDATFKKLFDLEKAALIKAGKQMTDVKRTVFTVGARSGGGYEYKLNTITYF